MRNDSEAREHGDIDFGLREKPEEALPKRKQGGLFEGCGLRGEKLKRREKLGAEDAVGKKKGARGEENAENQHAENSVDEPGPNGEGHARQGHAFGAKVERGGGEVDRGKQGRAAEERDAGGPEREAGTGLEEKREGDADKRQGRGPERKKIEGGKSQVARADLERKKIIAKAGLGRGGEDEKDHERAMKHGECGVAAGGIRKGGKEWNVDAGPDEVNAHEERQKHADKHAGESEPEVTEADRLVIGMGNGWGRATVVVVGNHANGHYTS